LPFSIARDQVVWRITEDEATVIHTGSTNYYGLNPTGTFIWNLLDERDATLDEIVSAVSREYETEPDSIRGEIESLLLELMREQLIVER
jgi:PqqD family protein of HPr-rel-A system